MTQGVALLYCGEDFFVNVDEWHGDVDDQRREVISVVYTGLDPCSGTHHLKTQLGRFELGSVVKVRHLADGRVEASFRFEDT